MNKSKEIKINYRNVKNFHYNPPPIKICPIFSQLQKNIRNISIKAFIDAIEEAKKETND